MGLLSRHLFLTSLTLVFQPDLSVFLTTLSVSASDRRHLLKGLACCGVPTFGGLLWSTHVWWPAVEYQRLVACCGVPTFGVCQCFLTSALLWSLCSQLYYCVCVSFRVGVCVAVCQL